MLDARIAYLIGSLLHDVVRRGTGHDAMVLKRNDLAGKTGSTNDHRDAWFTGYNDDVVASAWVGFDDFSSLGRANGVGEFGAQAALPMWIGFMRETLKGVPEKPLRDAVRHHHGAHRSRRPASSPRAPTAQHARGVQGRRCRAPCRRTEQSERAGKARAAGCLRHFLMHAGSAVVRDERDARTRRRIAVEAARLISEHGIRDYHVAKRKAAERLGIQVDTALPKNSEIEDALREYQRLFQADEQPRATARNCAKARARRCGSSRASSRAWSAPCSMAAPIGTPRFACIFSATMPRPSPAFSTNSGDTVREQQSRPLRLTRDVQQRISGIRVQRRTKCRST